jgi:hypothetical protein
MFVPLPLCDVSIRPSNGMHGMAWHGFGRLLACLLFRGSINAAINPGGCHAEYAPFAEH